MSVRRSAIWPARPDAKLRVWSRVGGRRRAAVHAAPRPSRARRGRRVSSKDLNVERQRRTELWDRVHERIGAWQLAVERFLETERAVLAFACRNGRPVVLKVVRQTGDEWRSGEVIDAFRGRGVVRAYEHSPGAVLMERLVPGRPLVSLAMDDADDEAANVLAQVVKAMSPSSPPEGVPTAADWGGGFDRYSEGGDSRIPSALVSAAGRLYSKLCGSQSGERLLHGDLHHYNILFDADRGWLAIDPKGVVAELEYEMGAALRNPIERPELFTAPAVVRRRVERFAGDLGLDRQRIISWAFAQAVLAAIWAVEDESETDSISAWVKLAETLHPMLGRSAGA